MNEEYVGAKGLPKDIEDSKLLVGKLSKLNTQVSRINDLKERLSAAVTRLGGVMALEGEKPPELERTDSAIDSLSCTINDLNTQLNEMEQYINHLNDLV